MTLSKYHRKALPKTKNQQATIKDPWVEGKIQAQIIARFHRDKAMICRELSCGVMDHRDPKCWQYKVCFIDTVQGQYEER